MKYLNSEFNKLKKDFVTQNPYNLFLNIQNDEIYSKLITIHYSFGLDKLINTTIKY